MGSNQWASPIVNFLDLVVCLIIGIMANSWGQLFIWVLIWCVISLILASFLSYPKFRLGVMMNFDEDDKRRNNIFGKFLLIECSSKIFDFVEAIVVYLIAGFFK